MEITELTIRHFGMFTDQRMAFHGGINAIYGENETGKSTMAAFVRAMLFGLTRPRGRTTGREEYLLREPWENSAYFEGSMHFLCGGKRFLLERSFSRQNQSVRLICETDGEELDAAGGDLEALLGGVTEAGYCSTWYLTGSAGETTEELAEELHEYMIQAGTQPGARLHVGRALDRLQKEKKQLERRKKQMLEETAIRSQELLSQKAFVEQELEELREEETACRQKLEELAGEPRRQMRMPEYDSKEDGRKAGTRRWKAGEIFCALALAAAALAAFVFSDKWIRLGACAVILAACLGVRYFSAREQERKEADRERRLQWREEQLQEAYRRQQEWEKQQERQAPERQRLQMRLEWLQNSRREKESRMQGLTEEYNTLRGQDREREELDTELAALQLALDTLTETAAEIYREYEQKLNERVSEILCELTEGRYQKVFLDENLKIRILQGDRMLQLWQVSRGTMEQICFALRMAAGELLCGEEPLPVLLDDAFLTWDDRRLNRALHWLQRSGIQVLLFSCQKREQNLL